MEQILRVYEELEDNCLYLFNKTIQKRIIFQVTHIIYNGFDKSINQDEVTKYSHSTIKRFVRIDHYVSNCYYENMPLQYIPSMEENDFDCYFEEDYFVKVIPTLNKDDLMEINDLIFLYKNLIGDDQVLIDMWGDHLKYIEHIWEHILKLNTDYTEYFTSEQFMNSTFYLMPQDFIDFYTYIPLCKNSYPKWFAYWLEQLYSNEYPENDMLLYQLKLDFVNYFYLNEVQQYQYQQILNNTDIDNIYLEDEFNQEFADIFFNDFDEINQLIDTDIDYNSDYEQNDI
jgi:hypothetical protein